MPEVDTTFKQLTHGHNSHGRALLQRAGVTGASVLGLDRVVDAPDDFRFGLPPKWDRAVSALAMREERQGKAVRISPYPRGQPLVLYPQAAAT